MSAVVGPFVAGFLPEGMISSPDQLQSSAAHFYSFYKSIDNLDDMKPEMTLKSSVLVVRDYAKLHVLAMRTPALDGKKLVPSNKFTTQYDMIRGFKALRDGTDKDFDFDAVSTPLPKIDNSATLALIPNYKFISLEQSLRDSKAAFEKLEAQA